MLNFLSKLIFYWKRPEIIIVTGPGRALAAEAIYQVLKQHLRVKKIFVRGEFNFTLKSLFENRVFVIETDLKKPGDFASFLKQSKLPILVVTHIGEIPFDYDFFAGEREKTREIVKIARLLPARGFLILNFDDETVRALKTESRAHPLTFGFQKEAMIKVSDIRLNGGTNFKINYEGNIVPIWLEKLFGKEQIYSALVAVSVGVVFNLNLVEISQALKYYLGLPGKMRLIRGIKNSWILDDSQGASAHSMIEALDILGKLEGFKRKIAVLGDIVGIGKYTIGAHETIGENVAKSADLLFTFGQRAHFIAKGARSQGMVLEKIFQFDRLREGQSKLQDVVEEGDLILVDGSKEMEMGKIVEEIKAV